VTIGSGETEQSVVLTPETASDRAVRYLRAMIFSGQLRAGDRLPPERDLGAHLGISRMTLRLALKVLESTGYIVTTRGSQGGSRVSEHRRALRLLVPLDGRTS
jgi:DNA-binding FadR family transcriptional regulator